MPGARPRVNGYDFVKADNRRRVEEALASTGYRPNLGARNLRRGRTGFVALVVPDLAIPYFGELAALVISAARATNGTSSSSRPRASGNGSGRASRGSGRT